MGWHVVSSSSSWLVKVEVVLRVAGCSSLRCEMWSKEDVDLMLRDGEKMVLVENASVLAGMEAMSRRRLVAAIAAPAAVLFADDIMDSDVGCSTSTESALALMDGEK